MSQTQILEDVKNQIKYICDEFKNIGSLHEFVKEVVERMYVQCDDIVYVISELDALTDLFADKLDGRVVALVRWYINVYHEIASFINPIPLPVGRLTGIRIYDKRIIDVIEKLTDFVIEQLRINATNIDISDAMKDLDMNIKFLNDVKSKVMGIERRMLSNIIFAIELARKSNNIREILYLIAQAFHEYMILSRISDIDAFGKIYDAIKSIVIDFADIIISKIAKSQSK